MKRKKVDVQTNDPVTLRRVATYKDLWKKKF